MSDPDRRGDERREGRDKEPLSEARSWARQLTAYGNIGMMFPVSIAIGFFLGRWADGRLDTSPWLSLVGFALGIGAALRHLIQQTSRMSDDDAD